MAPTILNPGDIAIVGYINNGNPDSFSFVNLVPIDADTVIYFTDNGWTGSAFRGVTASDADGNENLIKFTATLDIPAGTVIRSIDTSTSFTWAKSGPIASGASGSYADLSLAQGTGTSGDQLAAVQSTGNNPLLSGFTPIYQIDYTGTFENATTSNTGNVIPGLSQGGNTTVLFSNGATYAAFNFSTLTSRTKEQWRAAINDPANWTFSNTGTVLPTGSLTVNSSAAIPSVNLSVSTTTGSEAGTTAITVTATASSAVTGDQTVNLGVAGTGITVGDYTLSNPIITIPNGATSGSVSFTVVDDALIEGTETAVLSISNPSAGLVLGDTTIQNITIADNDAPLVPSVSITATDANAAESGTTVNTGSFTITRTGDTTAALTVTYTAGGTSTNGSDYNNLPGTVTIPAGQSSATLTITPVNDGNTTEGNETVILNLVDGAAYDLGSTSSATVTIADNTTGSLKKVGGLNSPNGAEIPAFDPGSQRLFAVAGATVDIYNISNTGALTSIGTLAPGFTPPAGTAAIPNSVATKNGIVAVAYAIQNTTTNAQLPGRVSFFKASDGSFLNSIEVGYLPDMLTFTPDGTKVLTANEGEPNSYGQANSFDPEGSISIINLANGVANAMVQTAGFTAFNSKINALKAAGVRIYAPGATVAQDLEPEYIAFSGDGTKAYVTLQENNAIAIVDIATATVTDIKPLGAKNHNLPGNGIDPSDQDGGINIRNVPVFGLYQPDAIASFAVNGQTYYITANEGDSRNYPGFNEEVRVGSSSYVLDPTVFPNAATLKQNANLGRLQLTNATGDIDGDGDIDRIEALGARSFSIWDASGNQVFDSGDQLERITAAQVPSVFNSDGSFTSPNFDTRSDNKGPEPEGVVIGVVNDRTYAFIGLERTGDVVVYEVTDPTKPQFIEYINSPADVSPEGLTFISAADSPTGKPLLVTANEVSQTVAVFEFTPPIRISDIQGAGHISSFNGKDVNNVQGIVTAVASNGFYLQDPIADNDIRTSEGIFVFTSSRPTVVVGDAVQVSGRVTEFRPGNNANNLTTTQITNPTINKISSGNALPATIALGNGGRTIPTSIIENDASNVENNGIFDPTQDGIDFYESLEGMRVQINNPFTTSPTNSFGEVWVLADNGANATSQTARGGSLINPTDFNPERIQIDDNLFTGGMPEVNVGAQLGTIVGVVNYNFNNYEVLPSTAPTVVTPSSLTKEVTSLVGDPNRLTVATFNVENLDPGDSAAEFNRLASAIVTNLKSPDIINLEEIQDNNGSTNDSVVDASVTYQTLINAIAAAGGPTYQYRQINPVDDTNGGEPGGNIRVGFLYNPQRVTFVDRPGGTSISNTIVTDVGNDGIPDLSASPGLIDPTNSAFNVSRKPLVGEFVFNGQTVYVIGNHFNSKGGDQPLFGPNQPPTLSSEVQRNQQATIVKNFVQSILAINPNANVIVAGDLNDFEFSNPLNILKSGGLNNLIETLPANERYTYNFEGNAQTLDHILVSKNLLNQLNGFDVVHINSEFVDQVSDHDPSVARFLFNSAPTALALSTTSLDENVSANTVVGTFSSTDFDPGNTFTYSLVSGTGDTDNTQFTINSDQLQINLSPDFETKSTYSIRVRTTDQGGLSLDKVLTIAINDRNDAPVLNSIQVQNFAAIDEDPATNPGTRLSTILANSVVDQDAGALQGIAVIGTTGSGSWQYSINSGTSWTDFGSVKDNSALLLDANILMRFNPALDYNGTINLNFRAWDQTSGTAGNKVDTSLNGGSTAFSKESAVSSLTINPVNDAPINTVPGAQTATQDSFLTFSSIEGNMISINDVDANGGVEQVKLSVNNGFLSLGNTNGLTVINGSDNSAAITIQGTLTDLNNALNGLKFTPDAPSVINGSVTLTIQTNDLGNTGTEGAKTDTDTITIAINPANLIRGTVKNGTLQGTAGADTIYAGSGNYKIYGNGGNDILLGRDGNDELYGAAGSDYIDGGNGNDKIYAYGGNNAIYGRAGNDTIYVGSGINLIDGGLGNDTIYLSGGQDTIALTRGSGIDTLYNYSAGSTRFNLTAGLTYNDLTVLQDGSNTLIRAGSEKLASLIGVQASSITSSSFLGV
ncbi:choice-of-anchor I family protein [Cyanobacteria bacterium FACHB-DQ100]|nr:choice-of-anchor I family protein [Cyanobacteria bacterium FACHB-DQ100]